MSYEVRIHAPSDLSEKWYLYIYSEGKIIKKFYKGLAKESTKRAKRSLFLLLEVRVGISFFFVFFRVFRGGFE